MAPAAPARTRPHRRAVPLEVTEKRIADKLTELYGPFVARTALARIVRFIEANRRPVLAGELSEQDVMLIAYADHVQAPGQAPLQALDTFVTDELDGIVSAVHILPFYPSTGDGGFSVSDYNAVNPNFGTWDDIADLAKGRNLMFDCVLNHISASHPWFQGFLAGEERYADYFITLDPEFDTTNVVRARSHPLFTPFQTADGHTKLMWTSFSPDQVDLNFRSPDLLVDIIEVVLSYVSKGARFLRFDASHFVWKESGTTCASLPQTHIIIKLLRDVLDAVDPSVIVINETNLPHAENITYFGDGHDEAQLVYNFALPPLLVHTLHSGDVTTLAKWAGTLDALSDETCMLNYTASHDGIGVRGASQIMDAYDWHLMIRRTIDHGGRINYRSTPQGDSPYEMCITFFDALSSGRDSVESAVSRFLVSQAIALSLPGVPAIYLSNFFGAASWEAGAAVSNHNRDVNRQKFALDELRAQLRDPSTRGGQVFARFAQVLSARRNEPAFHPNASTQVLDFGPSIFSLERVSIDGRSRVVALHNVTADEVTLAQPLSGPWTELITGGRHVVVVSLQPYETLWLQQPA